MPVHLHQIPGGMNVTNRHTHERSFKPSAQVLIYLCEGCGRPAAFGVDCNIRAASGGDLSKAGRWYCGFRGGVALCLVHPEVTQNIPEIIPEPLGAVAPDLFGGV